MPKELLFVGSFVAASGFPLSSVVVYDYDLMCNNMIMRKRDYFTGHAYSIIIYQMRWGER